MHMFQFIRPQPRFQIPVSRIAGWLAGCSPELVEMSQFIRSATFERLRMCVHENAHQQIPERCSGLSIFQFRSFALAKFQCSSQSYIMWGQKPNFHTENLKVAPGVWMEGRQIPERWFVSADSGFCRPLPQGLTSKSRPINHNMRSTGKLHYHSSL